MLFCKNSTEKSDSRVSLLGRTLLRISVLPLLIAVFLLISGRAIVSQDHRQELRICFRPIRTTIIGPVGILALEPPDAGLCELRCGSDPVQ